MIFLNTIMELIKFYALDLFHSITLIVLFELDSSLASGSSFQVGSKSF